MVQNVFELADTMRTGLRLHRAGTESRSTCRRNVIPEVEPTYKIKPCDITSYLKPCISCTGLSGLEGST
jgi:hypothetical protein